MFAGLALVSAHPGHAQTLAFPGAEGFGRFASGGRGGDVYVVTNLNDSGAGSLREGVTNRNVSVPRTIVFAVSGTIYLNSSLRITKGNLTIAGQTAPGDGICLANHVVDPSNTSNVIIRFIRSRLGDAFNVDQDAFTCRYATDVIIDHCSFSWSIDEGATAYDNTRFTMQWCFVTESLRDSIHDKGAHGYGGIWGGLGASFHHNLLAHHDSRNSRFCGARYHGTDGEYCDMRNNVIYNWRGNTTYGGEPTDTGIPSHQNLIGNYYKYGPATGTGSIRHRVLNPSANANSTAAPYGLFHVSGNYTTASAAVSADNWNGGVQGASTADLAAMRVNTPFDVAPVITQSAQDAYPLVLGYGGCRLPARDSVDARIAGEVSAGTFTYRGSKNNLAGIIDSQSDVGGWPALASLPASADSDADGMPDAWETARGLNPNNAADRNTANPDGYTNLEIHLNELAAPAFPIPQIGTQPQSQSVNAGSGFSLSVSTSGAPAMTYQWYRGNDAIPDATNASYSVASSTAADAGAYKVVVSNSYGTVASAVADVAVTNAAPSITTQPASLTVAAGDPLSLTVSASGTPEFLYQWYHGDRPLPGATGPVLDLGTASIEESGPYRVTVSNGVGPATSADAFVTVAVGGLSDLFSTSFGTDTLHAASPVVSSSATNWYVMSSKNATTTAIGDDPATSGVTDPRLNLTMSKTSSGIVEAAGKFGDSPIGVEIGETLRMRAVVRTSNVRTLGIGLFSSAGSLPHVGMNNSRLSNSLTDFATGGTRNWDGIRLNLDVVSGSGGISIDRRSVQPGTTNSSQSLIPPGTSSSAPVIQSLGTSSVPGFSWTDGADYTLTLSLKRTAADSLEITATIHAGTEVSAAPVATRTSTATGGEFVSAFDSMAIGFRNRDDVTVPSVRVGSVAVSKLSTAASIANPYQAFLLTNDLDPQADALAQVDSDSDAISNPLEFILGGNPKGADVSFLPALVSQSGWRFRFLRHIDTSTAFDLAVERSGDCVEWIPLENGTAGVVFTVAPFNATHEQVDVLMPDSSASGLFLRLRATPKP